MVRIATFAIIALLSVAPACFAQDTSVDEQSANSDDAARLTELAGADGEQSDTIASISDFIVLTFILVMFTNAVICGHWAVNTNRNFWGRYIFGLFTGPLAGGFMLHRSAREKSGEENPGGALGAIAGIGIPLAGWLIWVMLLK